VAVQATVLTPTGNKLPEGGEHLTVGEGSTLSVALTLNVTTAPRKLVALTVMLPGSDKMGAVTSAELAVTVYVALATVLFAIPLVAASARTVVVRVSEIGPVYTVDAVVGVLPSVV